MWCLVIISRTGNSKRKRLFFSGIFHRILRNYIGRPTDFILYFYADVIDSRRSSGTDWLLSGRTRSLPLFPASPAREKSWMNVSGVGRCPDTTNKFGTVLYANRTVWTLQFTTCLTTAVPDKIHGSWTNLTTDDYTTCMCRARYAVTLSLNG